MGLVPPAHTSQRRRCPQQCHWQPLKERGQLRERWGRRSAGGGGGRGRGTLWDSPLYSGGKKCRFRGSSRSARMGLRRSTGSATGSAGHELTDPSPRPPSPSTPTHHWRRCGATLHDHRGERADVNAMGCRVSSALGSRRSPAPPPTEPHPSAPEPILMRPLCCMKMVSLVRFPWMMGGLQA